MHHLELYSLVSWIIGGVFGLGGGGVWGGEKSFVCILVEKIVVEYILNDYTLLALIMIY